MPYIQLQFRRDTSLNWVQTNPLLASGEMGIELDTHSFKIGDGILRWNQLPYGGLQGPPGPAGGTPLAPGSPGQVLTFSGPNPGDVIWSNPLHRNRAIIKVPTADMNFNFSTGGSTPKAIVDISTTFGSNYTPGIYVDTTLTGPSNDTTGFSITLNPIYNMVNIPIIMGTIAYWNGQKLNYMQIKFGNSSSSNAVRATIVPGDLLSTNVNNIPTYGSPLELRIDGISSNAFTGAVNISSDTSKAPLNYALIIYLELISI